MLDPDEAKEYDLVLEIKAKLFPKGAEVINIQDQPKPPGKAWDENRPRQSPTLLPPVREASEGQENYDGQAVTHSTCAQDKEGELRKITPDGAF